MTTPQSKSTLAELMGVDAEGIRCVTAGCPGNAWEVVRTEKVPGGVRRVRRCMRCRAVRVTVERGLGEAAIP